ncbi:DNA-3-methyladenine glycosylase family protein [Methylobrevis albus]|uniref:DNA-3-methyladenine glycosylase II n=1 Tax=Methylobrevis albus TaxID=2793297 RepID=A0A931MYQ1_9HYPH|nr:DNA-3-methyladenine glycosylase 2 family protein [Methylobrevis albus]MBH0237234.1 DNA-3-methyladenine glycosylase 2 family protein [Methylobrevis albus]
MRRLLTDADMAEGLEALARLDPRLVPVIAETGPVALRYRAPGFEGVARIVVAQQLSVASAAAIWGRVEARIGAVDAAAFAAVPPEELRACGLSAGKLKTLGAVATAVTEGLDLEALAEAAPDDAVEALVRIPGIGRWTAEIFLLFCARNADIFPAGDLALQVAAADAFGLEARPKEAVMREIAAPWSPWRGVAAKLFWAYYKVRREGRTALPV